MKLFLVFLLIPSLSFGASTGAIFPGAAESVSETPWSDNAWTSPENIFADDGSNASITANNFDTDDQTRVLKAYTFDLSAIADGSTINGVSMVANAYYADAGVSIDLCQLLSDSDRSKVGTNLCATPEALGTSTAGLVTKGDSSNSWGNSLTASWVKNSNFGVGLGFIATGENAEVFVDYVTLEIDYTAPAGRSRRVIITQ